MGIWCCWREVLFFFFFCFKMLFFIFKKIKLLKNNKIIIMLLMSINFVCVKRVDYYGFCIFLIYGFIISFFKNINFLVNRLDGNVMLLFSSFRRSKNRNRNKV